MLEHLNIPAELLKPSVYSLPVVGALIGWLTNYIAIKMLFRPQRPIRILGLTLQGLVPKRQADLALKIADTIEKNLISHKDVQAVLDSQETREEVENLINRQVDIFLQEKLASIPMISMFLGGGLLLQVKQMLTEQFSSAIPGFMDGLMTKVESKLDFREIVRQKVEAFDLSTLEAIIYNISSRELKTIEYLGGLLGFLVGLAQMIFLGLSL